MRFLVSGVKRDTSGRDRGGDGQYVEAASPEAAQAVFLKGRRESPAYVWVLTVEPA